MTDASNQQILIVDAAHIDPARAQFPGLLVLANKAEGDDFTDLGLSKMAGRDVILWCHYAAMLGEADRAQGRPACALSMATRRRCHSPADRGKPRCTPGPNLCKPTRLPQSCR